MVTGIGDPRYINVGEDFTLGVVTAQDYKYASPQTNQLVVPAPQFVPDSAGNAVWEYGGYSGSVGCEGSGCTFEAPVVLPAGAVVTQIGWTYGDCSAGVSNFHFERNFGDFDHVDVITGDNDERLTAPCTKTFPISGGHTVDPDSHYGIYLPQGDGFYTFKFVIEYTTTAVGPATGRVAADGRQGALGTTAARSRCDFLEKRASRAGPSSHFGI